MLDFGHLLYEYKNYYTIASQLKNSFLVAKQKQAKGEYKFILLLSVLL
jgi:hypothetical protein